MRMRRVLYFCGIAWLLCAASPAMADCDLHSEDCWLRAHRVITHMENHIAYVEADPDADDGVKGRTITRLRQKVVHIRAYIGPRWPHWPTPCCYSRPVLYVR
jgi:hypothetical protein